MQIALIARCSKTKLYFKSEDERHDFNSQGGTLKNSLKILLLIAVIASPFLATGAGYQMRYQSAETMGTGFASDVTGAKTASGFFNNPSIIAFMEEGKHFSAEFTTLIPSGSFEGGSTYPANTADGSASGFGKTSLLPSLYYGQKISKQLFVTATLTVPWATNSQYDNDWVGRYQATKTFLATYNLTPSLTYAVNEKFAISGGVQFEYANGELGRIVDTGTFGGTPGVDDSSATFKGNNLGLGAAFSALYKYSDALRLGFQYRSRIKHNLKGDQSVQGLTPTANAILSNPAVINGGLGNGQSVEAEIIIPDNITLGASYLLNPKFDLHASLSWTGWSSFDALVVNNTTTGTSSSTDLSWKNTIFTAFGTDYYLSEKLILRGGISYETGAPPDSKRTPRGVDEDRMGLNLGASYNLNDKFAFHGAFTQLIFLDKPTIDLADPAPPSPVSVAGEYTTSASLIRLGVSAKF